MIHSRLSLLSLPYVSLPGQAQRKTSYATAACSASSSLPPLSSSGRAWLPLPGALPASSLPSRGAQSLTAA